MFLALKTPIYQQRPRMNEFGVRSIFMSIPIDSAGHRIVCEIEILLAKLQFNYGGVGATATRNCACCNRFSGVPKNDRSANVLDRLHSLLRWLNLSGPRKGLPEDISNSSRPVGGRLTHIPSVQ